MWKPHLVRHDLVFPLELCWGPTSSTSWRISVASFTCSQVAVYSVYSPFKLNRTYVKKKKHTTLTTAIWIIYIYMSLILWYCDILQRCCVTILIHLVFVYGHIVVMCQPCGTGDVPYVCIPGSSKGHKYLSVCKISALRADFLWRIWKWSFLDNWLILLYFA